MAYPLAQDKRDQLKRLKKNVESSREFFQENYKTFNQFRQFIFKSTLTDDDITSLNDLSKPVLEFNILEPYISRLCGEFSKQEPSIEVFASQDVPTPVDVQTVKVVDGIIRTHLDKCSKNGDAYEVFKDLMSGGFSMFEIFTDYENDMTFNQNFNIRRVFDPTMTGFDPMARSLTKSDGKFCYYLYPMYVDDFKEEYPDVDIENVSFIKNTGFSWSYRNQRTEKVILLCDYYEKKKKRVKIVRLSNNMTMTMKQYQKMLDTYEERQIIAMPPEIVEERYTQMETICRYKFIENQVISYEETDFKYLPLVFVDGNSIWLRESNEGEVEQFTRPFLYHARDIQRLKNFAGQTLANELENMVQHKFKVAEESIPPQYKDAYEDIQHADTLVYKAFSDEDPNKALPPPQEIIRTPIPAEVSNTFASCDSMTQNILGSFDIQMGKLNNSQLSGLAIQESVTQSNATAMPYVVGYLQALTQIANIIVDLIPKYWKTPRTIPIMTPDGKRSYVPINKQDDPNSISLDYCENALHVNVEAGVNFQIQKTRALQQIIGMMQASPAFAGFMNSEGLPILLDNLEIRGIDQLKMLSEGYVQQQKAAAAKAQQQNPEMMKFQLENSKLQAQIQQNQADNQLRSGELANDAQANKNEEMKIILQAQQAGDENLVQKQKAEAETFSKAVESALSIRDHQHRHLTDAIDLTHKILTTPTETQTGTTQNA
jgi:hypothetical protein